MVVIYKTSFLPQIEEIIDLFNNSKYFPIHDTSDLERIKKMFLNADIVVSAWDEDLLIGLSRSLSDFCYCCYLSDLCVRNDYQRNGIGRELVKITKELAGDFCKLILQSSPDAVDFYSTIGMEKIDSAFVFKRQE